jgi:hypothetical protein
VTGTDVDLAELRWHWGSAHLVHHFDMTARWVAQRRDSHATANADDPSQLLGLVRAGHAAHPVPCDPPGTVGKSARSGLDAGHPFGNADWRYEAE